MADALAAATGAAVAAAASAVLTAAWTVLARQARLLDAPGARRLHAQPTPRGGGIGIALVSVLAFAWWSGSMAVTAGVALFALVGLADDLWSPGAVPKLLLQLLAAGLLASGAGLAGWPAWAAATLAVAYLVNAFNFMDGSNGLLALQGLALAVAVAAWPGQHEGLALAGWALAGACLGFLPFNLPKARVFLGDVGSHAIGAAAVGLLLLSCLRGSVPVPAALLMLTPLLVDTGFTLARRAAARKPVWRAHREHLYQYAVRSGHSHLRVGLAYAAWTAASAGMALAALSLRSLSVMWSLLIVNVLAGAAAYFGMRRHWLRTRRQGVH
jgi:UDP-N-acetylmuramyl pentapeptide phosphotransferase/UDP-N-acetylglucosamine-1-phosphate transferase